MDYFFLNFMPAIVTITDGEGKFRDIVICSFYVKF